MGEGQRGRAQGAAEGPSASEDSAPKTWVAVVDIVAGLLLLYVVRATRRPADPERTASMIARMNVVASSPAIAIVAAGARLATPAAFIPLALKEISELDRSGAEYAVAWLASRSCRWCRSSPDS
jgi:hypothetical protein